MEKIDYRTLSDSEKYHLKVRAVKMVESGKKKGEVALLIGTRPTTLGVWYSLYKDGGCKALRDNKRGVKSGQKKLLSASIEKKVQKIIVDKMPDQLKLPFGLWTRKAVQELIKREFGVSMAINTTGDYLRTWGFTPQRPKKRAYERDDKKVQKWLDEEYPKIRERAIQEGATIYWGDETSVQNSSHSARSYSPKGKTPVRKQIAKKMNVGMISAIANQGQVEFMMFRGGINVALFTIFLSQLIKNKKEKIYLIVDNLRVHHAILTRQWVQEHADKIELFYLPSYSPEKNPDEYLNCDLKYQMSELPTAKSEDEMEQNINNHMKKLYNDKLKVASFFRHEEVIYAA